MKPLAALTAIRRISSKELIFRSISTTRNLATCFVSTFTSPSRSKWWESSLGLDHDFVLLKTSDSRCIVRSVLRLAIENVPYYPFKFDLRQVNDPRCNVFSHIILSPHTCLSTGSRLLQFTFHKSVT